MNFLRLLAGPLIGAVIGYCTNYIAVKMLFRPLYPVKIGNRTLPFTPGIIPRGKSRLAKALGSAVGDHLITKQDLEDMLLSDGVKNTIVSRISEGIQKVQKSDDTVEGFLQHYVEQEDYEAMREKLENFITERITEGLDKLDVGSIIAEEGAKEVKQKFQGSMVSMFLTDDLISSIAEPIGRKVGDYIRENGHDKIHPVVVGEIAAVESRKVSETVPDRQSGRGEGKRYGCAGSGEHSHVHYEERAECCHQSGSIDWVCHWTAEPASVGRAA